MTRQEMFDKAYLGLASQGFRRSIDGVGCAYRGKDGCKCAIGWLIPDDKYHRGLERMAARRPIIHMAAGIIAYDVPFAEDLQYAHDGVYLGGDMTPAIMKSRLADVAKQYGLTIPLLKPMDEVK